MEITWTVVAGIGAIAKASYAEISQGSVRMRKLVIAAIAMIVVSALLMATWIKQEHRPAEAIAATQGYIDQTLAKAVPRAEPQSGWSWEDRLRSCKTPGFDPYQTNGNRLRRLFNNVDPDPAEVRVDFFDCSIRFYLRKQASGSWHVYYVRSHAG